MNTLEHLRQNSRRIDADRVAHNHTIKNLAERINDATLALANAEQTTNDNGKLAPYREALRKLKQERAAIRFPAVVDPLAEVEIWIKRHPSGAMVPTEAEIKPGETPLAAHNRHHAVTASILTRIRGLETAPQRADELRALLAEQVAELAKAPAIIGGRLTLPKVVTPIGPQAITTVDAMAVMAWAFKDHITKAFARLIEDDATAISAEDRAELLGQAYGELLDSLRQEAACAMAAEQAGQRVQRRRSIHPMILLGRAIDAREAYKYLVKGA